MRSSDVFSYTLCVVCVYIILVPVYTWCVPSILNTVAAENCDVPHLPGHEAGRQSISEPDQDKKDNSSATTNVDPKPNRPASQCTTLVNCIILSLCIYAVVQLLVLVSSVLDFLSSWTSVIWLCFNLLSRSSWTISAQSNYCVIKPYLSWCALTTTG